MGRPWLKWEDITNDPLLLNRQGWKRLANDKNIRMQTIKRHNAGCYANAEEEAENEEEEEEEEDQEEEKRRRKRGRGERRMRRGDRTSRSRVRGRRKWREKGERRRRDGKKSLMNFMFFALCIVILLTYLLTP